MIQVISNALTEAAESLERFRHDQSALDAIQQAAQCLITCFRAGGKVISCGNGGSMSDAMHFAEELSARYRLTRAALPAIAISDPGYLSCVGNDLGYDAVFSRAVEAYGKPGDVLFALSTSGKSPNILKAMQAARARSMQVIGLTGRADSPMSALCDVEVCAPGNAFADRSQELHIKVIHILIELVERELFPELY